MNIVNKNIDGGKGFDWGRVSADYAKFRDIYPRTFYEKIVERRDRRFWTWVPEQVSCQETCIVMVQNGQA